MQLTNRTGNQIFISDLNVTIPPFGIIHITQADANSSAFLANLIRNGTLAISGSSGSDFFSSTQSTAPTQRIEHSSLAGLGDDDHMQYILSNGARGFLNPVKGKTPTDPEHLATLQSVGDLIALKSHNSLTCLQGGTSSEYYHYTQAQHDDLISGNDSTAHYHASDRNRTNHTGTQLKVTISDFAHTHVKTEITDFTKPCHLRESPGIYA